MIFPHDKIMVLSNRNLNFDCPIYTSIGSSIYKKNNYCSYKYFKFGEDFFKSFDA